MIAKNTSANRQTMHLICIISSCACHVVFRQADTRIFIPRVAALLRHQLRRGFFHLWRCRTIISCLWRRAGGEGAAFIPRGVEFLLKRGDGGSITRGFLSCRGRDPNREIALLACRALRADKLRRFRRWCGNACERGSFFGDAIILIRRERAPSEQGKNKTHHQKAGHAAPMP